MTAIFMSFSRAGKRSSKRKTEITGKQTDSKDQLYKSRIAEKGNGSGDISDIMNWRNVYDCYFDVFQQKWKEIQKKKDRNSRKI